MVYSYRSALVDQTERALWSVKNVMDCIPDTLWERPYCGMPLWKHLYHMLHSLDQWFINPEVYTDPPFHLPGLNDLDTPSPTPLSRQTLEIILEPWQTRSEAIWLPFGRRICFAVLPIAAIPAFF